MKETYHLLVYVSGDDDLIIRRNSGTMGIDMLSL